MKSQSEQLERQVTDLLDKARRLVPAWCCDHQSQPCVSCALEYLVENALVLH